MITEKVANLKNALHADTTVSQVVAYWDKFKRQIQPKLDESLELRNFVFATDTSTTSNNELGEFAWKNSTHLPKLCEIRDILHSVNKATWFPNDDWLKWEAFTLDESTNQKKVAIEAYMQNKVRGAEFEEVIGDSCGLDVLDYGNCFAKIDWRDDRITDENGAVQKEGYVGPVCTRISPEDIVFNLTAARFEDAPKVIRCIKTAGEMKLLARKLERTDPERAAKIEAALKFRRSCGAYSVDDFNKAEAYRVDGFGNYKEYLESDYVELLEFRGSMYDSEKDELKEDHVIVVMDRSVVIQEYQNPSWIRNGGVYHAGWRKRPDSLWCMGPLDNLVGMQYRVDHLQGAKDDNIDLHIHPTKVIIGDPDETNYGPNKEIRLEEGESIQFISPDLSPMALDQEIQYMLQLMEDFAGAPRQSKGIRTPGEKTLGEVQLLEGNANRLFMHHAIAFEKGFIEKVLNGMLDISQRSLNTVEEVRVYDEDLSVFVMQTVVPEDLKANGLLRPIGARHIAARNQQLSNLMNIYNSGLAAKIDVDVSGKALGRLIKENLQLDKYGLISDNVSLFEQAEAQRVQMQLQSELQEEMATEEPSIEERAMMQEPE